MSGSISLSSAPLSDADKTDVRRFCGYEAYGGINSSFQSYRFFVEYGKMEFRLSNLAPAEYQVVRQYLSQLYQLEANLVGTGIGDSDDLDTARAAVWQRNPREIADRTSLFDGWRRRLCGFLGVPPGPALSERTLARII
jgi:hypothetical protein